MENRTSLQNIEKQISRMSYQYVMLFVWSSMNVRTQCSVISYSTLNLKRAEPNRILHNSATSSGKRCIDVQIVNRVDTLSVRT